MKLIDQILEILPGPFFLDNFLMHANLNILNILSLACIKIFFQKKSWANNVNLKKNLRLVPKYEVFFQKLTFALQENCLQKYKVNARP